MANDEEWRNRRLVGGRWRDPKAMKGPARADRTICVRLTAAELEALDDQVAQAGIKRNRALRIAARRIAGFVEMDREALEELRHVSRQIGGVARNVNQIARVAHVTQSPQYEALMEERQHLGREMARLAALLQRLLEVGTRRTDGLRRLKDAATS